MRFVVIGCGGTGGWLSMGLAASIEYTKEIDPKILLLVDGDNFEPKNQQRQHFINMGNKAQVRAAELQPMYPNVWFTPEDRYVVDEVPTLEGQEGEENTKAVAARELLVENDVIFLTVDNFRCRADVTTAASELDNVDVFLVGNDDEYFGSVYHYRRREGVDVTPNPVEFKPELFDPPDRNPGLMSCQERAAIDGGTQFIWTNMACAAWVGAKVNQLIFKPTESDDLIWDECMFDLASGTAQPYTRWVEAAEHVAAAVPAS